MRLIPACLLSVLLVGAAPAHDWNGIAIDSSGRLYVVDAEDGQLWRVSPDGKSTVFVPGSRGRELKHPHHLAPDATNTLWLASG